MNNYFLPFLFFFISVFKNVFSCHILEMVSDWLICRVLLHFTLHEICICFSAACWILIVVCVNVGNLVITIFDGVLSVCNDIVTCVRASIPFKAAVIVVSVESETNYWLLNTDCCS